MATYTKGDYKPTRGLPPRQIGTKNSSKLGDNAWIESDEPHRGVVSTYKALATAQQSRLWHNTRYFSMYANHDFMASLGGTTNEAMPRMADNQLKIHTDTLAGKLVQANSRIRMQTSNGDWATWNRARKIEWALDGEFNRMKLYREAQKVATDAIICGIGYLELAVNDDGDGIDCTRVYPNDVFFDEMEAVYGKPRTMYRVRYMRKDALLALWPQYAAIIEQAECTVPPRFNWTLYRDGMVEVVEAWATPVGKRKGRHVIALSSGCLLDEAFKAPEFPIIPFVISDKPFGGYGQGFAEQVFGTQLVLNRTIQVMERAANLGIAPYWVLPSDGNINIRQLQNRTGHVVNSDSGEPKWMTNQPFHEAAVKYVQMLKQTISDFFGANAMETGGQLPIDRLDSKKALRQYQDMTATRITTVLERWQDFYLDVAGRTLDLAQTIAKKRGAYPVLTKKAYKSGMTLDWKDLDIRKDAYQLFPAPADFLSKTPSGKIDDLKELMDAGLISQKQGQRFMQGPPDIDAAMREATATEEDIDRLIEGFIDDDYEYRAPSSMQDLPRAIKRVSDARLQYASLGLPKKQLALFDRYVEDATDLMQTLAPPPPQPGAGTTPAGTPNGQSSPSPSPGGAPGAPGPSPSPGGAPAGPAGL